MHSGHACSNQGYISKTCVINSVLFLVHVGSFNTIAIDAIAVNIIF